MNIYDWTMIADVCMRREVVRKILRGVQELAIACLKNGLPVSEAKDVFQLLELEIGLRVGRDINLLFRYSGLKWRIWRGTVKVNVGREMRETKRNFEAVSEGKAPHQP